MISHSVLLRCSPERAFTLFTQHIDSWWPAERRHAGDQRTEVFLLPNGQFFERTAAGHQIPLGKVVAWEPPDRIVLDFYPGTDPDHPTEATITFSREGARTRVTVQHRPLAASEHLWEDRAPRYVRSWEIVLDALGSVDLVRPGNASVTIEPLKEPR
ncbi:MAG: SRPBCC domain-containing protein [Chloroflexota bacterium]